MKAPGTQFHPLRVQGRRRATEICAAAQAARETAGDAAVTYRAIAKRFAVASKTAVAAWFTPGSGHAIALGDVLAVARELAREVLVRALAELDEGAPATTTRDTLDHIGIQLGHALHDYRNDLRDGREDDHAAHEANLSRIVALGLRGLAAIRRRKEAA